ncbi:MAG: hypothetical protein SGJ20_06865 [Planctomycetota bacterium]|nr:hypothetical protein [Planctomycetota bacterium]
MINEDKELYLEALRLSSPRSLQANWPRIVRHNVEATENLARFSFDFDPSNVLLDAEGLSNNVDRQELNRMVALVLSQGQGGVVAVFRALSKLAVHEEALRAITDAISHSMEGVVQTREETNTTTPRMESFLQRAKRLDLQGQTDSALDLLYDAIDEMMRNGQVADLDAILNECIASQFSTDILIGLLTATLPVRTRLPYRRLFFREVEKSIKQRGEYERGLLTGLE